MIFNFQKNVYIYLDPVESFKGYVETAIWTFSLLKSTIWRKILESFPQKP